MKINDFMASAALGNAAATVHRVVARWFGASPLAAPHIIRLRWQSTVSRWFVRRFARDAVFLQSCFLFTLSD